MNTLICLCLIVCVGVSYAAVLPGELAAAAVGEEDVAAVPSAAAEETLDGQESRWGGWGGRGWGRGGWGHGGWGGRGGGWGHGGGWGYGGGRGWGHGGGGWGYGGGYGGWGR